MVTLEKVISAQMHFNNKGKEGRKYNISGDVSITSNNVFSSCDNGEITDKETGGKVGDFNASGLCNINYYFYAELTVEERQAIISDIDAFIKDSVEYVTDHPFV